MPLKPLNHMPRRVRVVLSTPPLLRFASTWTATGLTLGQLGIAGFFISGVAASTIGEAGVWCALAAWVLSAYVRAIDIESWALLISGGLVGRVQQAFGPRATALAVSATLIERLL